MSTWPARWRARWIWFETPDLDGAFTRGEAPERPLDGFGYLRRSFTLPEQRTARCRVTADSRYVLFVNGVEIGRGPVRSQPWRWTYDEYTLGLPAGENVVAAFVRHYGGPTNASLPAQPVGALGYGSFLFELEAGDALIISDDAWRAHPAPYARARQHEGPPPPEIIDGRALPRGWASPGSHDEAWPRAIVVDASGPGAPDPRAPAEPFPVLQPRPIPPLAERTFEMTTADGTLFDAGGIVTAHPIVELDADPGTTIEVIVGEAIEDGAPVLDVRSYRLRYTAAGVAGETIEGFEPVGFRFARAQVLDGATRNLVVRARERVYPRPDGMVFRCEDEDLNRIWQVGVRTLEACSTDAFIDCPGREQRAWLGDAYGHSLLWLLLDPDPALVRWNLRLHAHGARPDGLLPMVAAADFSARAQTIPDHTLEWVLALAHTWRWTGDHALVEELLPTATRALSWFEQRRGDDGLLWDVPGWVFIDWAQLERGRTFAPLDGLYALACDDAATLAAVTGDDRMAEQLRARAARTRAGFETLWDPARGLYLDTVGGARASQHTNALAILSGAAPRERWDAILDAIMDPDRVKRTRTPGDPGDFGARITSQFAPPEDFDDARDIVEAQPFFSHFLHQALARAGRFEQLLASIRRWLPLCEPGTFGEYWENRPGLASFCHAWTAVPLFDLATHILGLASDGSVEPHLGPLAWAEARLVTRAGITSAAVDATGRCDIAVETLA